MIDRYIASAIIALAADVLAFLLAPIAALFAYRDDNDREQLIKMWGWIYTHDAPIDSGHVDGYWETTGYWSRVKWIWRNPAYAVSHWLGYDQRGMTITKHKDEWPLRDSGQPNTTYYTAINAKNERAFMYFRQIPYSKTRVIEVYLGWKLLREDEDQRCMLAVRLKPWKKVNK